MYSHIGYTNLYWLEEVPSWTCSRAQIFTAISENAILIYSNDSYTTFSYFHFLHHFLRIERLGSGLKIRVGWVTANMAVFSCLICLNIENEKPEKHQKYFVKIAKQNFGFAEILMSRSHDCKSIMDGPKDIKYIEYIIKMTYLDIVRANWPEWTKGSNHLQSSLQYLIPGGSIVRKQNYLSYLNVIKNFLSYCTLWS